MTVYRVPLPARNGRFPIRIRPLPTPIGPLPIRYGRLRPRRGGGRERPAIRGSDLALGPRLGPRVAVAGLFQRLQDVRAGEIELGAHLAGVGPIPIRHLELGADRSAGAAVGLDGVVRGAGDLVRGLAEHAQTLFRPLLFGQAAIEDLDQVGDGARGALKELEIGHAAAQAGVRWPYRHRGLRIMKTLLPRGLSDRVSPDQRRSDRRAAMRMPLTRGS